MPILFKNAKKEVQRQYDDLKNRGFNPVANSDGSTYSWIHKDTGEVYKGLDPISGIDADNGYRLRNHRQQRLMSELASANLVARSGKSTPVSKPSEPTTNSTSATTPAEDKATVSSRITGFNMPTLTLSKLPEYQKSTPTINHPSMLEPKSDEKNAVEDLTPPVYDVKHPDTKSPFVYIPTDEWKSILPWDQRAYLNKYGTSLGEIMGKKNGNGTPADDNYGTHFKHFATINGVQHSLVHNPDWVDPGTKPGVIAGQIAEGLISPMNIRGINSEGVVGAMTAAQKATGKGGAFGDGIKAVKGWFKHGPTAEVKTAELINGATGAPQATEVKPLNEMFNNSAVATPNEPVPGTQYSTPNLVPKSQGEQLNLDYRDAAGKFWGAKNPVPSNKKGGKLVPKKKMGGKKC